MMVQNQMLVEVLEALAEKRILHIIFSSQTFRVRQKGLTFGKA